MFVRGGVLKKNDFYKSELIIYKNHGKFYQLKNIDAYIMNIIFNYKVINNKCGFPDTAFDKIIAKLNELKINYEIVYDDEDPIIKNFHTKNNYENYKIKAVKNISIESQIKLLEAKIKNASEDDLKIILELINEKL